jgi:hypothetical protein
MITLEEIEKLPHGINNCGYVICYLPKGHPQLQGTVLWKFKHRLVMEFVLGRLLSRREDVHHINGDKKDNRPCNLQIETRQEHGREHNPLRGVFQPCLHCGKIIYRSPSHIRRERKLYCSKVCASHSVASINSQKRNLTGRTVNVELNTYIAGQKNGGRTWLSLSIELGLSISTVRDRYDWYKNNIGGAECRWN